MGSKLSLCMIARNEEKNIQQCLESVAGVVDEMIVIDTGSQDATCRLAKEYGATVQSFLWNDNFSAARNVSLELAAGDWILFLDADERLAPHSGTIIRRLVEDEAVEGYFLKIINYLGSEGCLDYAPDLVFRLFRNRPEYRFHGAVHEQIVDVILEKNNRASYQIAEDLVIHHYGYLYEQIEVKNKKQRNLQLLQKELDASPDNRLLQYHYGVELFRSERYEEAAAALIKAANGLDPHTIYLPKLLRNIVMAYHLAAKAQQALEIIALSLRLFPDYADLYYYKGLIHYEQKEYGSACSAFRYAVSLPAQPLYYAAFSGLQGFRAYYYLGRIAERFDNQEEALRFYILSLRDNPQFITALAEITRLLNARAEPDYADQALQRICEFCTPQAYLTVAQILFKQYAFQLALTYLEQGQPPGDVPREISLWKAICLIQERRFFESLRLLEDFEPDQPLYPLAKLNQLFCFWLQGNLAKVRTHTEELFGLGLSLETGSVVGLLRDTLSGSPMTKLDLGDEGTALFMDILTRVLDLREWAKAEALLVRFSQEWLADQGLRIGELCCRLGNTQMAERYVTLYLKTKPGASAYDLLAGIKKDSQLLLEAAELYRQAIALEPKEPAYYLRLIQIYQVMQDKLLAQVSDQHQEASCLAPRLKEGR